MINRIDAPRQTGLRLNILRSHGGEGWSHEERLRFEQSSTVLRNDRVRSKFAVMMLASYWMVLFIGTHIHIPSDVNKVLQEGSDKLIHAGMYAVLAVLWAAWRSSMNHWNWRETVQGIAILALYAMGDELLQIPVGRHADVADWFADCLGLVVGFTFWWSAVVLFPRSAPSQTSPST